MMRVLFYVGDKQWSGTSRAALVAARGLAARKHQVCIACCSDGRLERDAVAAGIDVIRIDHGTTAVGGAFDLRRVLMQRTIEVAVVTAERDHLIVASAMRFAERGAVLRRVPSFDTLELQRAGRLALRLAAGGIIVSSHNELSAMTSSDAGKELKTSGWSIPTMVVPLGVDASAYDAVAPAGRGHMRAPPGGLLIACSYDPSGRYRMGAVFRTLALLAPRHVNIHVAVFGPGSADDELRMHASALGVSPVVSFLGERDDELSIIRAADAGWVVSGGDSAAFALLDFMALRVPVIAERSAVTQHYVSDGISGLLLAPGDPSSTASRVASFLTNDAKHTVMGNAARARAQRDFPETAMIDAFERAAKAAGDRSTWVTS